MALLTAADLAKLPTIRFPKGNDTPYGEDFRFYRGIPADVEWYIAKVEHGTASLVRPGHGVAGNYGDGSLLVKADHIWPGNQ